MFVLRAKPARAQPEFFVMLRTGAYELQTRIWRCDIAPFSPLFLLVVTCKRNTRFVMRCAVAQRETHCERAGSLCVPMVDVLFFLLLCIGSETSRGCCTSDRLSTFVPVATRSNTGCPSSCSVHMLTTSVRPPVCLPLRPYLYLSIYCPALPSFACPPVLVSVCM